MKTIVRYEFDSPSFFPKHYQGIRFVRLIDPPIVPSTGDMVTLRIEEFFDDADLIMNYKDQTEGDVYYAQRLNTIVGKDLTEVVVVLYEEADFKICFPQFFRDNLDYIIRPSKANLDID